MSGIPLTWARAPIGQLCELLNGRAFKPTDWTVRGLPIVRIQNLNNSEALLNHFDGEVRDRFLIDSGELLFAWSGTPGTSFGAHIWQGGKAILNQHIFKIQFSEDYLNKRYFRYAIDQKLKELIDKAHGGVGLRHVTKGKFEETEIELPPRAEQDRIVAKLDSLCSRSSRARRELDRIPILIARYRQAILAKAFSGELTADWRLKNPHKLTSAKSFVHDRQLKAVTISNEPGRGRDEKTALIQSDNDLNRDLASLAGTRTLPSQWCWAGLGEVFEVYVGATPSRKESRFWDGAIPWVSSGEVAFCRISSTEEMITQAGLDRSSTRLHPIGTVLLGMIGEGKTRGQAAILDIPACNNQNCAAIRVAEAGYSPEYVYWYLYFAYQHTRTTGAGNNQPALNKERVQRLPIPLAPPEEAKAIADAIATAFAWLDKVVRDHSSAKRLLTKLDQAILAKAFRGELVAQDPNDEPADILLQRLKLDVGPKRRKS